MTRHPELERLLHLLHGDHDLYERLCQEGLLPRDGEITAEHAETARVVGTLVHELEVNWAGTEVILHMRSELVATQRQVAELLVMLRERRATPDSDDGHDSGDGHD